MAEYYDNMIPSSGSGSWQVNITYTLTVQNGITSGEHTDNYSANILANAPPSGYQFSSWSVSGLGSIGNPGASSTTFTMGIGDATVTANYSAIPYTLTVLNGTGGGTHYIGDVVTISATPPSGNHFASWSFSGAGSIASTSSSTTTVTMGAGNATATDNYAQDPAAPSITGQPSGQSASYGSNATFSISASGNPAPTYQWQRRPAGGAFADITDGGAYSGATTASLTISGVTAPMDLDQFRCVVMNSQGSATSSAATLNDADNDGVSDAVERSLGLNPNDPSDTTVHWYQYDGANQMKQAPGGNYTIDAEGNINKAGQ